MMTVALIAALILIAGSWAKAKPRTPQGLTQEDLLWLARALVGETEGSSDRAMAAVSWAMLQRWQQKAPNKTFTQVLRSYCQPINPKWASLDAAGCRSRPEMCTVSHLARRQRITNMTWEQIPSKVMEFVYRFGRGEIANPVPGMIDFAAFQFPGEQVIIDGNHFGTRRAV